MEVAITSTTAIKTIEGGLSEFWKFRLECVFFNKSGHDLSTAELNIGAADPAKFIAGTVYYSSTNLDNRK